jgi:DNA helicase-2/ATP-dependent DNA helicase PcrA
MMHKVFHAGANINNILNFQKDYEGVKHFRLEQNYRSTKILLKYKYN